MKLNNSSFVHVTIHKLCLQIELLSGMKLVTDLNDDFYEIRFVNAYGYIVIDWRRNACFSLSHKVDKKQMEAIQDIMLYCRWLEIGDEVKEERKRRNAHDRKK